MADAAQHMGDVALRMADAALHMPDVAWRVPFFAQRAGDAATGNATAWEKKRISPFAKPCG